MKWLLAIGLVLVSMMVGSFPYGEHSSASDRMTESVETNSVVREQETIDVLDIFNPKQRAVGIMETMYLAEQDKLLAQ